VVPAKNRQASKSRDAEGERESLLPHDAGEPVAFHEARGMHAHTEVKTWKVTMAMVMVGADWLLLSSTCCFGNPFPRPSRIFFLVFNL
jgi:hypothetical protein